MLAHLPVGHGAEAGLGVVLLLGYGLAGPGGFDAREERDDVECAGAEGGGVDYVVVMVVEDEGDVEGFTGGKEIVDRP